MTVRILERIVTQTLLGIRFCDGVTHTPIVDGLRVTAQLLSDDGSQRVGRAVTAMRTRGGIYAFHGLHPAERPAAAGMLWETTPPERSAAVDVRDLLERYLPASFVVPVPFRGPFRGADSWLGDPASLAAPAGGEGIFLWPGPGYRLPAGLTALYAQLVVGDADEPPPAAHAVVQVLRPGTNGTPLTPHAYGLTDDHGRLTLPLAYPPVPNPPNIDDPYPPLVSQIFSLTLRVFHQPAAQTLLPAVTVPDLGTILTQAQAQIARQRTDTLDLVAELAIDLPFGAPLVLRTATADPERPESFLRLDPA